MTLIAFDLFNVVILESDGKIKIYSKKGSEPRELNESLATRLGDIGFKKVSIQIKDIWEAWSIADTEALKNLRISY